MQASTPTDPTQASEPSASVLEGLWGRFVVEMVQSNDCLPKRGALPGRLPFSGALSPQEVNYTLLNLREGELIANT